MGDTISLFAPSCLGDFTTINDFVVIQTGEYNGLRKIVLESQYDPNDRYIFYEGIGHGNMFFITLADTRNDINICDYVLGCVFKDDTVAFSNPDIYSDYIQDCEFRFVAIDQAEEETAASLYPNPCHDLLQIENLPEGVRSLYITDMLGRRVYSTTQSTASIPTDWFAPGTYQLTLVLPNNRHHTLSFVKR